MVGIILAPSLGTSRVANSSQHVYAYDNRDVYFDITPTASFSASAPEKHEQYE
jgi:hypothetical protein